MKTATLSAALLAAALSSGGLSLAVAMPPDAMLQHGHTLSHQVGGTQHYALELDSDARVMISTRAFDPLGDAHIKLRGTLLDAGGQVVATPARHGSHLSLDRRMPAGRYTLVVDSWNTSARQEHANLYLLRTRLHRH